jgi:hypothetical protein
VLISGDGDLDTAHRLGNEWAPSPNTRVAAAVDAG